MMQKKPSSFTRRFVDLLLYGNFWIALGAVGMAWQTRLIFTHRFQLDPLTSFIFFGTLFIYGVHRIVGISKLHEYYQVVRYAVIASHKRHIEVYAFLGLLGSAVAFFYLKTVTQLALIIPGLISVAYVAPVFGGKKRLRDLNDIKIFLVAMVWAWVTVLLPGLEYQLVPTWVLGLVFAERAIFVFAITLPFDIRDLMVDQQSGVRTIPAQIGVQRTRQLAYGALLLSAVLAGYAWQQFIYSIPILVAILVTYLLTAIFVSRATPERHDYFYSGLMDGTMILSFLLVWGGCYLFG